MKHEKFPVGNVSNIGFFLFSGGMKFWKEKQDNSVWFYLGSFERSLWYFLASFFPFIQIKEWPFRLQFHLPNSTVSSAIYEVYKTSK
jgi:hypothetical protein